MSEFVSVSDSIEDLFKDAKLGRAVDLWKVNNALKIVFDEKIKCEFKVLKFRNGLLIIEVSNSVWAQELSFMKNDIVSKLNDVLKGVVIDRIMFKEVT